MKNIVIIGNTKNCKIADNFIGKFNIIAGIVDYSVSESHIVSQKNFLKQNNIPEITIEGTEKINADAFFIIAYNKIIPEKYINNKLFLNIHGGILPKYKGRSANLIALLNNEPHLGYTLHQVDSGMDTGPIYKTFTVENNGIDFVEDIITRITEKTANEISRVLDDILNKRITPKIQSGEIVYATPLRKEDGYINWNNTSNFIFNLFRIYGGKNGSGIFFSYKDKIYKVKKMSIPESVASYVGITGCVTYVNKDKMYVKTKDSCILIEEIEEIINDEYAKADIQKIFKIGVRL